MANEWIIPTASGHDGTSQPGRSIAALSPDYVAVDERTVEDLIDFVRDYGKTLTYFNAADEPDGDFGAFIGSLSAKQVAAFLQDPAAFDPDRHSALFRPHFTLFAVFLKLLQRARGNLNRFTARHLDYHFRRFLQMQPRAAVPDRVNLVLSLADREAQALVPAGTLVSAGVDALGKDRLYKTTTNVVVNRAKIEQVSSLFVDRQRISIVDTWHDYRNNGNDGRFEMLRIAYGRPLPGDPLPNFKDTKLDTALALGTLLGNLRTLVKFCGTNLTWSPVEADKPTNVSLADLRLIINKTPQKLRNRTIAQTTLSIPGFPAVNSLDTYWKKLLEIEDYFAMPVESFEELLDKIQAWDKGYPKHAAFVAALLERAHHDKLRAERRQDLKTLRESKSSTVAYSAILQQTLFGEIDAMKGAGFVPEFEDALRTYLTEPDAKKLQEAAKAEQWDIVLDLLAHAMTLRIGKAPPRKTVWRNLFPAENARTVLAKRSKEDADGNQPFSTFGGPLADRLSDGVLGFAVTSPILALSSGKRTITLTLGLRPAGKEFEYEFEQLKKIFVEHVDDIDNQGRSLSPLAIEVSTVKGWLRVNPVPTRSKFDTYDKLGGVSSQWTHDADAPGLSLVIELAEGDPAIAPLAHPPDGLDPRYPAIRILMQPVWNAKEGRYVTYYRELTSLFVGAVFLKVNASGLLPTAIENDESLLDPKKPFEPFGSMPAVGSVFSFGHPEIVTKKIDRVKLSYQWLDVPTDLSAHYANYGITLPFKSTVQFFDTTGTKNLATGQALFASPTNAETTLNLAVSAPLAADHASVTKTSFSGRVKTWRRYLQWQLEAPHFQHREYPAKAAEMSLKLALDLANPNTDKTKLNLASYQVKPPYTPKLAFLKLEYDSSVEVLLYPKDAGDRQDRAYHVHPFGVAELRAENNSDELPFLPRYDAESELCIGLSGVALPQTVTILLRLDEGSADRDIAAPPVTWSQLSGNRWIPLGHRVLRDETRGLQTSGVVALSLEKAEPNTLLPAHLTWVRASITQDHDSICDTRTLHTQAVSAMFEDRGNAPEHYHSPLPGKTITRLQSAIAGIVGVAQPDPSFGGRPPENESMFSTRVSERLRHKQRALSTWDYERLVLDAFPAIFKAKCIPRPEKGPGRVEVLVIPDVRALPTNELGPKAPIAMLSEIEAFLQARVPGCARVNVRNAQFRAVRVRLGVRFAEVGNDIYWMGRLNEELNRFLSPWAYDEGVDIAVGGRIYASSIVDFVDRCDYVDYMAGVSLFYTDDEGEQFTFLRPPTEPGASYCVEASGVDQVLVAYPQHRIDLITSEHYDERLYRGISYMEMEMDFVVG